MANLILKVKTKSGQQVLQTLKSDNTIADLKKALSLNCNISEETLNVLSGFPPKALNLDHGSQTIAESGVHSGDTLIVDEKPGAAKVVNEPVRSVPPANPATAPSARIGKGVLLRKVVPADNSCLFTSIGYVMSGKIDVEVGSHMRQLIVEHVRGDPVNFNDAILGKPPAEYCSWILKPESWGGAIELSILSMYYGIEIAVIDTVNGIVNRFGEDQNYGARVLLIFDGIHYDPIYLESIETGQPVTLFQSNELDILTDAQLLAEESKSSRQFTDVNKFSVKCLVCQTLLSGSKEASNHAEATGHVNFGEV